MTNPGRPGTDGPVPVVREEDIRPVSGRGGSRFLVLALVFAGLGIATTVVKPWEALSPADPGAPANRPPPTLRAEPTPDGTSTSTTTSPACASPQSWRSATIETWFGRTARVWSAVDAGDHAVDDPALPFEPVVAERLSAIGWCAPIAGPERPPVTARASLWRVVDDRVEQELWYVRMEPEGPNALGELWAPPPGNEGSWPPGRYVIELRTPSGSWRRTIGIEVFTARPDATPAPSPSVSPSPVP